MINDKGESTMKTPCPTDEMLADYVEGRLSNEERSQMEEHLSVCKNCLEELVVANSLVRGGVPVHTDQAPAEVTNRAVHLVQRSNPALFGSLSQRLGRFIEAFCSKVSHYWGWKEWRLEPIRGSKIRVAQDVIFLRKTFRDLEAEIEVEKTAENRASIHVRLLQHGSGKITRVTLMKGEREVSSYLANGASVLFEDIPFGHYNLTFTVDSTVLGRYHFEVREAGHGRR